jgi:hypothetical protein
LTCLNISSPDAASARNHKPRINTHCYEISQPQFSSRFALRETDQATAVLHLVYSAGRHDGIPVRAHFRSGVPSRTHVRRVSTHQITVQFLTHAVTLNGWNLAEVARQLANGKIGSLQALPRPASPPPVKPWISEIQITAISDTKPTTTQP